MTRHNVLILTLALSIGMNLFFIGGIAYRLASPRDWGPRPVPPNIDWVLRDLPESRQAELAPLIGNELKSNLVSRRDMFRAQREINRLISAENFDPQALSRAFEDLRQLSLEYQAISHEQMVALISALSPAERETALAFMQRRGPRDRDFDGRDDRRGPKPEGNQAGYKESRNEPD